jgi:hypothetical protein
MILQVPASGRDLKKYHHNKLGSSPREFRLVVEMVPPPPVCFVACWLFATRKIQVYCGNMMDTDELHDFHQQK